MLSFIESPRFNTHVCYATAGGPEFQTDVITVTSGAEQRNANWLDSRGKWTVGEDVFNKAEIDALIAFFRERMGKAGGFRFKDWSDWSATIETGTFLAVPGSTTQLQLAKRYANGEYDVYRPITKPVPGTVRVFQDGLFYGLATSNTTLNPNAGINILVLACYAAIGRSQIGQGDTNIDQAGYDFWASALTAGTPIYDMITSFLYASSQRIGYPEAGKATALLADIARIPTHQSYISALVHIGYAALGRTGFGTTANTIDQNGYDFWVGQLASGAVSPNNFMQQFLTGATYYQWVTGTDYTPQVAKAREISSYIDSGNGPIVTYFSILVKMGFAALGRVGIGADIATRVDAAGYAFWLAALQAGNPLPQDFFTNFFRGAAGDSTHPQGAKASALMTAIAAISSVPAYYATMVLVAYASLGRTGFGTTASTIDQAGYNFWVNALTNNNVSPENFFISFLTGAARYTFTSADYSAQIPLAQALLAQTSGALSMDFTTGLITLGRGNFSWAGEFDVPARFDVDTFNAVFNAYRDDDGESLFTVSGLTIVELRTSSDYMTGVTGVTNTNPNPSNPPPGIVLPPPVIVTDPLPGTVYLPPIVMIPPIIVTSGPLSATLSPNYAGNAPTGSFVAGGALTVTSDPNYLYSATNNDITLRAVAAPTYMLNASAASNTSLTAVLAPDYLLSATVDNVPLTVALSPNYVLAPDNPVTTLGAIVLPITLTTTANPTFKGTP